MTQAHILVVDDDKLIIKTLRLLLSKLGYRVTTQTDPNEALKWLRLPGNSPDLIISDVMMPQMSGYDFVGHIRADPITAHLPVILLTANSQIDNKVEGFKAGADDYLIKPVDRVELEWRIKALLARSQASAPAKDQEEASVISVFSLRGGVGTSTVAVNLSVALAGLWGKEIPLMDLAFTTGHCALMLNINPKLTLFDIVGWDSSAIEAETIEKLLLPHRSGVKLLAAPKRPTEAEMISPDVIDRVWPYLRATYPFIVVDSGSQLVEPTLTMLERSEFIVLLLAPELGSLKAAVDALHVFKQLGFDPDKIYPIINHTFPEGGIPKPHIENSLKRTFDTEIPYNKTDFIKAINSGKPHMFTNPNSLASRAITKLAYELSSAEMEDEKISEPSPLLNWVRKLVTA